MKINKYLIMLLAAFTFLGSCSKTTDDGVQLSKEVAPVLLTPDGTLSYVLTEANENNPFETFIYEKADYGKPIVTKYTIELDKPDGDFSEAMAMQEAVTIPYQTISVKDFNIQLNALGVLPEVETVIKVRVKASSSNSEVSVLYSNEMELKVTPYDASIPPLWLVGDATSAGWTPEQALEIVAVSTTEYDVIADLTVGTDADGNEISFGILGQNTGWGPKRWFWDDFEIHEGVILSVNQYDEKQFRVAEAGTYKIEINLGNKSIKATKQSSST
ncbi:MAG: SusE domain-containing protein [Flavobacteriales bacterium]|nr:SusE domain-containing protein [Flavobacteriales bacterium]